MAESADLQELQSLLQRLSDVRRHNARRLQMIALCSLTALFAACFLAFSGLDIWLKLAKNTRLAFSGLSLAAALALLAAFVVVGLKRRKTERKLALDVEARYRELGSSVSTSIEFGTDPEKTRALSSEQVVDLLIKDTSKRTARVNFLRAVDWAVPARVLALLGVVLLVWLGFYLTYRDVCGLTLHRFLKPWADLPAPTLTRIAVSPGDMEVRKLTTVSVKADVEGRLPSGVTIHYELIPEGQQPTGKYKSAKMERHDLRSYSFDFARLLDSVKYYVTGGDCKTNVYMLRIYEVPRITQLKMTLTYPAYTGMKPRKIEDAVGPITALRGTKVSPRARSSS